LGDPAKSISEVDSLAVRIDFDTRVYSVETLQRAALKFTRIASFDFRVDEQNGATVLVTPFAALKIDQGQFAALFRNEVLDQHLRRLVANETEAERNLILAYAFSNTKLVPS